MTKKLTKPTTKPARRGTARARPDRKPATKADQLIKLLKARSGRDVDTLSTKLGWQPHTTRAALSRLRKAGNAIDKLPPGKHGGARYRISNASGGPAR